MLSFAHDELEKIKDVKEKRSWLRKWTIDLVDPRQFPEFGNVLSIAKMANIVTNEKMGVDEKLKKLGEIRAYATEFDKKYSHYKVLEEAIRVLEELNNLLDGLERATSLICRAEKEGIQSADQFIEWAKKSSLVSSDIRIGILRQEWLKKHSKDK